MYHKLKTRYINEYNETPIDSSTLKVILQYVAEACPFSTFGYIKHNYNSKQCIDKTKSGNCIALSLMVKQILNYYGIKSILIPATVPNMFADPEYLEISHVALCIPYETYAYILDPAFYFMEPMKVYLSDIKTSQRINSYNIYSNNITPIDYTLNMNYGELTLNTYQTIPKDIFYLESSFVSEPSDKWYYYLVELTNPDEAITSFYISLKRLPFITALNPDYSMKLMVKFLDKNTLVVKENYDIIYNGSPKELPDSILEKIKPYFLDLKLPKNILTKTFTYKPLRL